MLALSADPLEQLLINFVNSRIGQAVDNIDNGIRERAPVDTGRLRQSIQVDDQTAADVVRIVVSVDDEEADRYGLFQDLGTAPHIIEVRDAQALSDGSNFFGTRVNHPGSTRNRGWFSDAPFDEWLSQAFE